MQTNSQNQGAANNVFTGLKNLNPVASLVVDYFSKRERTARTTSIIRFQHELESEYKCTINWDHLVATFKFLNDAKAGALITGKTPDKHRFDWELSLIDVAKAATGELGPEAIKAAPTGKTRIVYPVGYRPKKRNKNAVRAKRAGIRGRIAGGKNTTKTAAPAVAARVFAQPAPPPRTGIEVMVIEGDHVRRYQVAADKEQVFLTVLPAFAVAK